jgi:hypothetical protein
MLLAGVILWALTLTSCGEGTSSAPPPEHAVKGMISGFGDLHVNGIQYATGGASISIDGQPARLVDLQVGMVVEVRGGVNRDGTAGVATAVEYDRLLRGPATEIDLERGTVTVLGQTVHTDYTTFFHHLHGLEELHLGDQIEISGFPDKAGSFRATYLARTSPGETIMVTGTIVDSSWNNSLTLGVTPGGRLLTVILPCGGDTTLQADDRVQVSATAFDASRTTVTCRELRRVAPPFTASEQLGGGESLNSSGTDGGNRERHCDTRITAEVDSVALGTFSLMLGGLTVFMDERTAFRDDGEQHLRNFGLAGNAGIKAGDLLEVGGYMDRGGFHAVRVIRK